MMQYQSGSDLTNYCELAFFPIAYSAFSFSLLTRRLCFRRRLSLLSDECSDLTLVADSAYISDTFTCSNVTTNTE